MTEQTKHYTVNGTYSVISIVEEIDEIEKKRLSGELKPVQAGDKRISLISEGLVALGNVYGVKVKKSHCNSNGEFEFNLEGSDKGEASGYGEQLAMLLNKIHTRTGINAKKGFVIAQHSWLRINHFEAERLLNLFIGQLKNY